MLHTTPRSLQWDMNPLSTCCEATALTIIRLHWLSRYGHNNRTVKILQNAEEYGCDADSSTGLLQLDKTTKAVFITLLAHSGRKKENTRSNTWYIFSKQATDFNKMPRWNLNRTACGPEKMKWERVKQWTEAVRTEFSTAWVMLSSMEQIWTE